MRMMPDAANKPPSERWFSFSAEIVLLFCSVKLSSVLLNVLIVVLVKEFMKESMLPLLPTSTATKTNGRQIAWMMVSQLSSIPFLGAFLLKHVGKRRKQDLFLSFK